MTSINFRFLINQITSQTIVKKEGRVPIVLKCYESGSSLKWFILSPMFKSSYPYVVSPSERMKRELEFFLNDWETFRVPRVIDFDLKKKCVKREYLDARPLERPEDFELVGVALNEIHSKGYLMGDTKPQNYLVKGDTIYVIDAEQAIKCNSPRLMAWDLVVLFFFASYLFINSYERFKEAIEHFKQGYPRINDVAHYVFDYHNLGLLSIIPAPFLMYLRRSLLNS